MLVIAVLVVSYASSLRAYLTQRDHLDALGAQIETTQAEIDALEREKRRWEDPSFIDAQARERLGYLRPGEIPYVVLEGDDPLASESTLSEPAGPEPRTPEAWWSSTWESVEGAGDPPDPEADAEPPPAASIDPPDDQE